MATVNLFWDTRSSTIENEGSVKIAITHNRVKRLYTTGLRITAKEWELLPKKGEKLDERVKDEIRRKLYHDIYSLPNGYYRRAESILEKLGLNFDFDAFRDEFDNWGKETTKVPENNVILALQEESQYKESKAGISTALNYDLAAKSLQRFINSLDSNERKELDLPPVRRGKEFVLRFEMVTVNFLEHYENWMKHYGRQYMDRNKNPIGQPQPATVATINSYLRNLRAVFNKAIDKKIIAKNFSPFNHPDYEIPTTDIRREKGLPKEEVIKIFNYECDPLFPSLQRSKDFWIFCYISKGMNFADLLQLKWANVDTQKQVLSFVRQKTRKTKKEKTPSKVMLTAEHWEIINRHGSSKKHPNDYLFGILDDSMTPKRQKEVTTQTIKISNRWIDRIAKAVGIETKTSTGDARYSYITEMSNQVTTVNELKAATGHSSSIVALGYTKVDSVKERKMTENLLKSTIKPDERKAQLLEEMRKIQKELEGL